MIVVRANSGRKVRFSANLRVARLGLLVAAACQLAQPTQSVASDIIDLRTPPPRQDRASVVEPDSYRTADYRMPVPATLSGATVLSSDQAHALWSARSAVFIDVYPHAPKPANLPPGTLWRETTHQSIENAKWLPNVGYGVLSAKVDSFFRHQLATLSGGDSFKPLVFFCLRDCWMSWNAAKRALSYGYRNVHWYPDGSDGWQEIGQLVTDVVPEK